MDAMKWMQYAKSFLYENGYNAMSYMYFWGYEEMSDNVSNDLYRIYLWWKGSQCVQTSEAHKGRLDKFSRVPRVTNPI